MARRVLLVDPDLDAPGELSAALRGNGFTVLMADTIEGALERAKQTAPDIILASIAICHPGELTDRLKSDAELAKVPSIVLVKHAEADELPPGYAAREAFDQLMAKIMLARAGISVAVGGAPDDVMRKADHVAPPCRDGAVAWALRSFVDAHHSSR